MHTTLRPVLVSLVVAAFATAAGPARAGEPSPELRRLEDQIRARDDRIEDLEAKMNVLVDELTRMREAAAVPEVEGLEPLYGFGPAASKVFHVDRGLSIGGYGEVNYTNFIGDSGSGSTTSNGVSVSRDALDRADALRLVLYLGYKFSDRIVFNSELEFEHALVGEETITAGSGEVAVEFMTLDFLLNDWANLRMGLLLPPMGFLNEIHEPPFFLGVQRPETERRILPSTWREVGVGLWGHLGETVQYRSYLVNGFNARGFSDSGIRGGRQSGNRALAEDFAWVTRLDWFPVDGLELGGSVYWGDTGQDQELQGHDLADADLLIFEGHAQYRRGPLHLRGLVAMTNLADAGELSLALMRPVNRPIADKTLGGYVEIGYDVWRLLFDSDMSLMPFVRVEYVDTQYKVPAGFTSNDLRSYWLTTAGVNFKPHPGVVLKLEYRNFNPRRGELPDELGLGMGFAF